MTLSPGTKLGRYEICSLLGAGGMGEVYRARDPKIGRDVAIKILPADLSMNKERLSRFEREACAAGALNHPNVLSVFDIGQQEGGSPFIVSELLEGENLREKLSEQPLPPNKAVDYAAQIARGLAAAHERGIVHRDLKPENIFVMADGRVKILDFGLAKLAEPEPAVAGRSDVPTRRLNTAEGVVLGTIGYMSPEQVRGRAADHRTDIFSFGCVLYEMLSGRRAFGGESVADTMSAILNEDPPEISGSNRTISPALERVVRHCLEKNPTERFQSARDLAFALEALGNTQSSGATVPDAGSLGTKAAPDRSAADRRGKIAGHWPWWLAALTIALVLVIGARYFQRSQPPEAPALHASILFPEDSSNPHYVAVSPSGRWLAFTAVTNGSRALWVRPVDAPEAQVLPGTEDASSPFWSPDSRSIAFFAGGKLKRVEAAGGPVLDICDVPRGRGGTWNSDGVILFTPDTRDPIYRVAAAGGAPEPVTEIDTARSQVTHRWPHFLPDGRHFVFFARSTGPEAAKHTGIYVSSIDSKQTRLVVNNASNSVYAGPGYLLFVRDGNLMAQNFDTDRLEARGEPFALARGVSYNRNWDVADFSASTNGVLAYVPSHLRQTQIAWYDRTGRPAGTVGEPGYYSTLRLSPDEQKVGVFILDPVRQEGDIWLIETARGNATRFTFSPQPSVPLVWSPDGRRIAYALNQSGVADLYQKSVAGAGGDELLLKSDYYKSPLDWSPDGRYLAYAVIDPKSGWDIWIMPLTGGEPFEFISTPFNESSARFSPDGRWLAYESNESGREEVYVQAFPGSGGKQQASGGGGFEPRWSADGKELYYLAPDRRKLLAIEVKAGSAVALGAARTLFEMPERITGYDITPDGQRFLIATPIGKEVAPTMTIVLNWTENLKR